MASVFFIRHQAAGILTDYPFAAYPSAAQQDALAGLCLDRHGALHPKTKEPYWLNVVEIELLGTSALPAGPDSGDRGIAAGVKEFTITGSGTVTPKQEG